MEANRAIDIISALAEGIDPTTGEILPEDSVCNKGEVVRAFYAILNICGKVKETRKANKKEPDDYDVDLYNRLKAVRNKIAEEKGVMPFRILPNYPLMHMAAQKPLTNEEFLKIYGVGKYTTKQYANEFIAEIKDYVGK